MLFSLFLMTALTLLNQQLLRVDGSFEDLKAEAWNPKCAEPTVPGHIPLCFDRGWSYRPDQGACGYGIAICFADNLYGTMEECEAACP